MHVLFVEDDAMNRRVVKDMLSVVGAQMAEAESAEIGLEMIERHDYDLILMDLRMPGMDGLEAIGHIRARGDEKGQLPLIVVTADMAVGLRDRCIAAGADDVIMKPVAMTKLLKAMSETISSSARGMQAAIV
jgi:CheY-like chemotaxis protein